MGKLVSDARKFLADKRSFALSRPTAAGQDRPPPSFSSLKYHLPFPPPITINHTLKDKREKQMLLKTLLATTLGLTLVAGAPAVDFAGAQAGGGQLAFEPSFGKDGSQELMRQTEQEAGPYLFSLSPQNRFREQTLTLARGLERLGGGTTSRCGQEDDPRRSDGDSGDDIPCFEE